MKKKLLIAGPVLLLVIVGAAYKLVLAPKPVPVKKNIEGSVVPLQKDFLINLDGGRYAKVSVALVMKEAPAADATAGLPQEAAIRAVVTDELTGLSSEKLVSRTGRRELLDAIEKALHKKTDEHVEQVLFTDITVQ